jgi:DNA (cytosine-5)-methyltransferase 1
MKVLDLFAGIGGFTLGLERAGFETVAFCEIEPYPQKVLAKHWPGVPIYLDVRELNNERLKSDGIHGIDVITGGFPCQDISGAGKQAGIGEGTRSGLWSEVARLIDDIQPRYAIMENVTALISGDSGRWFGRVLGDLAEIGYDAEWHCISASELGAHHHRDRVWIIAYPNLSRREQSYKNMENKPSKQSNSVCIQPRKDTVFPNALRSRLQGHRKPRVGNEGIQQKTKPVFSSDIKGSVKEPYWTHEPGVGRVVDGVSSRSHRIKGLGNAVVPQIPELIGRAIMQHEADNKCN